MPPLKMANSFNERIPAYSSARTEEPILQRQLYNADKVPMKAAIHLKMHSMAASRCQKFHKVELIDLIYNKDH